MVVVRPAVHRTILAVDVEGFGDPARTNADQVAVREQLYGALTNACAAAGVPWDECDHEDRGDGVLVVIPPSVPKAVLPDALTRSLAAELVAHNDTNGTARRRIRLRMAIHAGEIHYDEHGVAGRAVNLAFRLLEATELKAALARSSSVLALIVSDWFFDEVVWQSDPDGRVAYERIRVVAKETDTVAWIRVLGTAARPVPGSAGWASLPRQLPPLGRHFVGRASERAQLVGFLDAAAAETGTVIITALAGMAGIGKTALAMQWAHEVADRFPDGQLHVNLHGFDPQTQLDPAVALYGFIQALGVPPSGIPTDLDARTALYRSLVAGRRLLVVLDNARSAEQVRPLLPTSSGCLVIVTSRNRLDGLAVREGAQRIALDVLPVSDAVALLGRRVAGARLRAEPDAVLALVDLCARLPLALSIAAARAANQPLLPVGYLVDELRTERTRLDAFDLGDSDLDVRAVFSWSYRAVSPPAARLFRLIGLHPGPDIDTDACAALVDDRAEGPLLAELTTAHLVEEYRPGRFRLHDLLRAYARERVVLDEPAPELRVAIAAMIDHYLTATIAADCRIQPCRDGEIRVAPDAGPRIATYDAAMNWLAETAPTILAMIDFAADHEFAPEVRRLAWAVTTYLYRAGLRHERAAVHRTGLRVARQSGDRAGQVSSLTELARALARLDGQEEAMELLDEAAELVGGLDDDRQRLRVQLAYSRVFEQDGRYVPALEHAQRAWELAQRLPNVQCRADTLTNIARQHTALGRPGDGLPLAEQALRMYQDIGHREGQASALTTLGHCHADLGQHAQAIERFEYTLAIDREMGSRYWIAYILDRLGDLYHAAGRDDRAFPAWREALSIFDTLRYRESDTIRTKIEGRRAN
jgi:tetratricopeptide (TPR) repeat protein